MKITTIGVDLAKNVFQVHGVDERGKAVLKKRLKRDQMAVVRPRSRPVAARRGLEKRTFADFAERPKPAVEWSAVKRTSNGTLDPVQT